MRQRKCLTSANIIVSGHILVWWNYFVSMIHMWVLYKSSRHNMNITVLQICFRFWYNTFIFNILCYWLVVLKEIIWHTSQSGTVPLWFEHLKKENSIPRFKTHKYEKEMMYTKGTVTSKLCWVALNISPVTHRWIYTQPKRSMKSRSLTVNIITYIISRV